MPPAFRSRVLLAFFALIVVAVAGAAIDVRPRSFRSGDGAVRPATEHHDRRAP